MLLKHLVIAMLHEAIRATRSPRAENKRSLPSGRRHPIARRRQSDCRRAERRVFDHCLVVAQDILPEESADGLCSLDHQFLPGVRHIERDNVIGPDWQPIERQPNIALGTNGNGDASRASPGLPVSLSAIPSDR
jgi:hypothetical protein